MINRSVIFGSMDDHPEAARLEGQKGAAGGFFENCDQDTIFCLIEMKFLADKLIMKQAPGIACFCLPPWPVCRACKSVRVSPCDEI